jgi:hypothetical protein
MQLTHEIEATREQLVRVHAKVKCATLRKQDCHAQACALADELLQQQRSSEAARQSAQAWLQAQVCPMRTVHACIQLW